MGTNVSSSAQMWEDYSLRRRPKNTVLAHYVYKRQDVWHEAQRQPLYHEIWIDSRALWIALKFKVECALPYVTVQMQESWCGVPERHIFRLPTLTFRLSPLAKTCITALLHDWIRYRIAVYIFPPIRTRLSSPSIRMLWILSLPNESRRH